MKWTWALCAALALTAGVALGQPAGDPIAALVGPELDRVRINDRVYVALEAGGVAIVDVSEPEAPKAVGTFAQGRTVSRLLHDGEVLYLLEIRQEATPWSISRRDAPALLSGLARPAAEPSRTREAAAPAVVPEPPTSTPFPTGRVLEVRNGRAILDIGSAKGLVPGSHIKIISQRLEEKPDLSTGETVRAPSGEVTAILRVEQATEDRAMARLGRGDTADTGDEVALTTEPLSERLLVPRRAPFEFLAGFHARPFLGLSGSTKPFGMLTDAYVSWYPGGLPLAVTAGMAPIGFTLNARDRHYPATFSATVAYATDYFEVGLGGGALVGNDGPCGSFEPPPSPTRCEVNTGFTINQVLRLGALDGLNAVWRSAIFSRPEEFVFGVGRGELNLPVTRQLGLFGAGGGGENGWAFGEFGVRTYLNGTGARGTLLISAALGISSVMDGPSGENVSGPSVSFGMEWRL
jgi:hypothetical protein